MINEVALALLLGLFGWKIAGLYLGPSLAVAILFGWAIGRLHMEAYLEDWVRNMPRLKIAVGANAHVEIESPSAHRREDGKRYTVDGIGAMFRRYCVGTKDRPVDPKYPDFGLRDLRAKGATDMYRADRGIRKIQALLAHKSVQTTEIYLKGLISEIVRPNEVPIITLVKK
jgi:integrase